MLFLSFLFFGCKKHCQGLKVLQGERKKGEVSKRKKQRGRVGKKLKKLTEKVFFFPSYFFVFAFF